MTGRVRGYVLAAAGVDLDGCEARGDIYGTVDDARADADAADPDRKRIDILEMREVSR